MLWHLLINDFRNRDRASTGSLFVDDEIFFPILRNHLSDRQFGLYFFLDRFVVRNRLHLLFRYKDRVVLDFRYIVVLGAVNRVFPVFELWDHDRVRFFDRFLIGLRSVANKFAFLFLSHHLGVRLGYRNLNLLIAIGDYFTLPLLRREDRVLLLFRNLFADRAHHGLSMSSDLGFVTGPEHPLVLGFPDRDHDGSGLAAGGTASTAINLWKRLVSRMQSRAGQQNADYPKQGQQQVERGGFHGKKSKEFWRESQPSRLITLG